MKRNHKIAQTRKLIMVLLGLMSAILLFVQEPLIESLQINDGTEQHQSADDSDQSEGPSYQVMAYEVLLPIMSFNLFHSFDLLVELPSLENSSSEIIENTLEVFDTYFENLFSRIIAPNAP